MNANCGSGVYSWMLLPMAGGSSTARKVAEWLDESAKPKSGLSPKILYTNSQQDCEHNL